MDQYQKMSENPRGGNSRDYPIERREYIFSTYKANIDKCYQKEIAKMVGVSEQVFTALKKMRWWSDMEERWNKKEGNPKDD